jgi:DNA (cytosine-5)-methyltransferase 1
MIYGSVCSGIEAATVAWESLGWKAAFYSEIEAYPRAVLAHHYPGIKCHGDFTTIQAGQYEPIDLLAGGTPCQSFSVAGLRGGMADARGNLALEYLRLADRLKPRWIFWENVPGVLSSWSGAEPPSDLVEGQEWEATETSDFGCFLQGLSELGYGWAYRSLDAQYAGLAQRRERVFVVGYLGDWRRAAAVLFEPASLRGDSAPRRTKGKDVAPTISARPTGGGGLGTDFDLDGGLIARCLNAHPNRSDGESETFVTHSLRADGFDASEDGTGRGTPLVPVAYRTSPNCGAWDTGDRVDALTTGTDQTSHVVSYAFGSHAGAADGDQTNRSHANGGPVGSGISEELAYSIRSARQQSIASSAVRRLTPLECERLQGFPDDYTLIPYRGKPAADGPRYKALGNSWAVPVVRRIGRRIAAMEAAR